MTFQTDVHTNGNLLLGRVRVARQGAGTLSGRLAESGRFAEPGGLAVDVVFDFCGDESGPAGACLAGVVGR